MIDELKEHSIACPGALLLNNLKIPTEHVLSPGKSRHI